MGETPWRFKSSHPHSQITRLCCPFSAQTPGRRLCRIALVSTGEARGNHARTDHDLRPGPSGSLRPHAHTERGIYATTGPGTSSNGVPTKGHAVSRPSLQRQVRPAFFVWLPVRGASHYRVEFFRGRKKIFEARPSKARLELPERWTYRGRRFRVTPGRYRWSVRPGFGSPSAARYARAIVRSAWVVPK